MKYFQINCHQLSIVKFPIKVKASVFLLCLQSQDPGVLGFCGDAHGVVTRGDNTLQRAPICSGRLRLHRRPPEGLVRSVSPAAAQPQLLLSAWSPLNFMHDSLILTFCTFYSKLMFRLFSYLTISVCSEGQSTSSSSDCALSIDRKASEHCIVFSCPVEIGTDTSRT